MHTKQDARIALQSQFLESCSQQKTITGISKVNGQNTLSSNLDPLSARNEIFS